MLVDAERAVNGVLLCRRCGFLTVLDPTLRALLAIPAFNRSFVVRTNSTDCTHTNTLNGISVCEC